MAMTKDERDQQTHEVVMTLVPLIKAHEKAINGNGRRGLLDRMTRVESIAVIIPVAALVIGAVTLWVK
jgi:hypothetical protein